MDEDLSGNGYFKNKTSLIIKEGSGSNEETYHSAYFAFVFWYSVGAIVHAN
jgi:hypothetical protein